MSGTARKVKIVVSALILVMLAVVGFQVISNVTNEGPAPGMKPELVSADAPIKLLKLSALNNTVYYVNPGSIKSISKSGDHTKIIYINGSETQCKDEPESIAQRISKPVGTDISP